HFTTASAIGLQYRYLARWQPMPDHRCALRYLANLAQMRHALDIASVVPTVPTYRFYSLTFQAPRPLDAFRLMQCQQQVHHRITPQRMTDYSEPDVLRALHIVIDMVAFERVATMTRRAHYERKLRSNATFLRRKPVRRPRHLAGEPHAPRNHVR